MKSLLTHQPCPNFHNGALFASFETQSLPHLDSVAEDLVPASRSLCPAIIYLRSEDPPMPAKRSIRALDNAQSKGRKILKSINSGEPSHQQQPRETLFHGHNLRSRRQPPSGSQQIARKDQIIGREDPQKKYEQTGTSPKAQIESSKIP